MKTATFCENTYARIYNESPLALKASRIFEPALCLTEGINHEKGLAIIYFSHYCHYYVQIAGLKNPEEFTVLSDWVTSFTNTLVVPSMESAVINILQDIVLQLPNIFHPSIHHLSATFLTRQHQNSVLFNHTKPGQKPVAIVTTFQR